MSDWRKAIVAPIGLLLAGTMIIGCGRPVIPEGSAQMVDVLGSPTRAVTLGLEHRAPGEPVAVLFAGGNSPIEAWGRWLSTLAIDTPVVAYDRRGIGESPFDGVDPTPERIVEHARELLNVLRIEPPFLLVSHSWGGPLSLYFAGQYPNDVAGMVFIDPTNMRVDPAERIGASTEEELHERHAEVDARMAARGISLSPEQSLIRWFVRTPIEERRLPADAQVPTAVVLAAPRVPSIPEDPPSWVTEGFYERGSALRLREFTEMTQGHADRALFISEDADHFVHRDDPALVSEAVHWVLAAVDGRE